MYNAGRNQDGTLPIGNAYIAYDCVTSKLCVAAYLNDEEYFTFHNCSAKVSDASSWVSINGASNKLKESTDNINFMYVKFPDGLDSDRTIGK